MYVNLGGILKQSSLGMYVYVHVYVVYSHKTHPLLAIRGIDVLFGFLPHADVQGGKVIGRVVVVVVSTKLAIS